MGEQQRYGGSLAVEQCNNYTWVLTAVAEGGKSRDVQGEELGVENGKNENESMG